MNNAKIITQCLLCGGDLNNILELTPTPPANAIQQIPTEQEAYPLNLVQCQDCHHVQLDCIVEPETLYRYYLYVSGTSEQTKKHFKQYADDVIEGLNLNNNSFVCDIGSNDGTALSFYKEKGIKVLGIDPAKNIAELANQNGIKTLSDFFNETVAENIVKEYGQADVIVCNNCFAHNDDLDPIVRGVKKLLKPNGSFIIEVSYLLDVCEKGSFDLIYHEHIHQWHLGPMIRYMQSHGLHVYDAERISNQGGSLRVYIDSSGSQGNESSRMMKILEEEANINDRLQKLKYNIEILKQKVVSRLNKLKTNGKKIAAYGYAAKSTTLLYYFGLDKNIIDFVVDDNPMKIGYSPGLHIPILPVKTIYENDVDALLVLSWNFTDSIIKNNPNFGGEWIRIDLSA